MKANPLPASPPVAPAGPAAATAPDAADTGNDFVGMLMQLLGGNAPAALTSPASTTTKAADSDETDPTELAAMLGMPTQLPWVALPTTVSAAGTDPLELLGLASGAGKSDSDALLALKADLADTLDEATPDAPADSNDSFGSLSPLTDLAAAKNLRAETPSSRQLHAPVGSPQWADELGTKLTWMVDGGQQSASLKLSPDNLGPLEIRISIGDDKSASVWFGAAHADTRAAIEHALPRLREMFATQGLSLGDTGVFHEPPRDQSTSASRNFGGNSDNAVQEGEMMISSRAVSLLDAYA